LNEKLSSIYKNIALEKISSHDEKLVTLLKNSAKIIAKVGFEKTSIRELAKANEISLAGLYYYVKSKEELLFLIQYHTLDSMIDDLKNNLKIFLYPPEKLRFIIENHVKLSLAYTSEIRICFDSLRHLKGELHDRILALKNAYFEIIVEVLTEFLKISLRQRLDPKVCSYLLLSMMNSVNNDNAVIDEVNKSKIAQQIHDLFINGIKGGI
jgi:TetR/AcrR family transcriptional regulator, cholesterol catabolism regulator